MDVPIFTFPPLPHLPLAYAFNVPVLLGLLVLFAVFYSIVSSVIVYHWSAYGMRSPGILFAESLFFLGTVALFAAAGVSLFYL
jgi:hypothetical protein